MRLTGSFVTRFMEEWHFIRAVTPGCSDHERLERFLEAMKYELAEVIMPAAIAMNVPTQNIGEIPHDFT